MSVVILNVGHFLTSRHERSRCQTGPDRGRVNQVLNGLKIFGFQRNANLYLASVSMSSLAQGAYGVIQGLYILAMGFDESVLGTILSARMLAGAVGAIPAGMLSDRIGRKPVLVAAGLLTTVGYLGMAVSSSAGLMILFSCIVGIAQVCQSTSGAPLLAESSTAEDRARLFGVNFSLSMGVNMLGSLLGGILPRQLASMGSIGAFKVSLAVFSVVTFIGVLPAIKLVEARGNHDEVSVSSGGSQSEEGARSERKQRNWRGELAGEVRELINTARERDVQNLLVYNVFIGFGAGLVIPFFNVFLSNKLQVDTAVVGLILSLSQGATALAGLMSPVLARRYGKVATVVGTQMASIPFLLMIALPPSIYVVGTALFMRSALMNMSNPIASNFSMEIIDLSKRGKMSSLMRISDSAARAFSAAAAGYIMSRWSYEAPYFVTSAFYLLASIVYWRAFRGREKRSVGELHVVG